MLCRSLGLLLLLSKFCLIWGLPSSPTVALGKTKVTGRTNSTTKIDFFGGIPFASPPLGTLRFEPPVLRTSFPSNVQSFNATSFGPACLQLVANLMCELPSLPNMSEDCLTINVFRPAGISARAKLPVMFWTFGGGFHGGTSADSDPSNLIARSVLRGTPIVYVSFNYRVGPFGFPRGNEVGATRGVNLGIKDLLAALKWVQANIQFFGGDPAKVTVFGESAGAIMESMIFLDSQISGLARAAIFISGSPATTPAHTAAQGQSLWQSFVLAVPSCTLFALTPSTLPCMKKAPAAELLFSAGLQSQDSWEPVLDGEGGVLSATPSILYAQGRFSKIPFISGNVLDEGTDFVPQIPLIKYSTEFIKTSVTSLLYSPTLPGVSPKELSDQLDKLLALYPDIPALGSPYGTGNNTFGLDSGWKRIASLVGDLLFQSSRRMWLRAASSHGSKVYSYLLTQPPLGRDPSLGVDHPSTKPYFYGQALSNGVASDAELSLVVMDYWLSFATSLDPNDGKGTQRPKWEQWTTSQNRLLQLNGAKNQTVMIKDDFRSQGIEAIISNPLVFLH
ncbi:carboxylic ester hydrolase [Favolaschia claudopus]|uniref:Carboxylic ester hydrolase n=1 Tax=Favolaschia claudopus TaxID=2862362 RepID=A0AAW0DCJ2_9AGAR